MQPELKETVALASTPAHAILTDPTAPVSDGVVAALDRRNARRAAICVIGLVGSMLIYKMTALLDPLLDVPTVLVYGASGALFGAICGAVQRAEELEDRVLHTLVGAVVLGVVFACFSLNGLVVGPTKYRWS